ncbi:hypothetical protein FB459_1275 [Yimella lutea]|uniref:Uncharacterized protein n=1 Tax=Yimella lutea TaxID=587872 RepID=A0A542EEW1_9MICO|nr:hypothetical protein [Yimella lutea]TQJ13840.1 hypothetical protein FB459_1275 [Yimella lutea]
MTDPTALQRLAAAIDQQPDRQHPLDSHNTDDAADLAARLALTANPSTTTHKENNR